MNLGTFFYKLVDVRTVRVNGISTKNGWGESKKRGERRGRKREGKREEKRLRKMERKSERGGASVGRRGEKVRGEGKREGLQGKSM